MKKLSHCVKRVRIRSYSVPYSVRMRENTDQNNSEYGHFSRSARHVFYEVFELLRIYLRLVFYINSGFSVYCLWGYIRICGGQLIESSGLIHRSNLARSLLSFIPSALRLEFSSLWTVTCYWFSLWISSRSLRRCVETCKLSVQFLTEDCCSVVIINTHWDLTVLYESILNYHVRPDTVLYFTLMFCCVAPRRIFLSIEGGSLRISFKL